SKMEKGSPSVPIGYWLVAGNILNRLSTWKDVFAEQENLFARFDKKAKVRRRAGGRRKKER
ncbi:MAG: hypothetical protein KAJ55_14565, partial [Anaerolineales bacterium]|nr:hypothetical protein [Anaerolineales bacterium]